MKTKRDGLKIIVKESFLTLKLQKNLRKKWQSFVETKCCRFPRETL